MSMNQSEGSTENSASTFQEAYMPKSNLNLQSALEVVPETPKTPDALSRFQRSCLGFSILLVILAVFLAGKFHPPAPEFFRDFGENDFLEYWSAFELAQRGQDLYHPGLVQSVERRVGWAEPRPLMMWNPPWTLTALMPILARPFDEAARAFLGLNVGLAVAISIVAGIALGFDGIALILVALFSLVNFPLYMLLAKGQISLIPTLGISLLFLGLRRNSPVLAGLAMLPLSIKPHLAFLCFIPLFLESIFRRWKKFYLTAALGMGVLLFLTWVMFPESFGFWWSRAQHETNPLLIRVTSWKTTTLSFVIRDVYRYYTGKFIIWPMWAVPGFTALVVLAFCLKRPTWLRGKEDFPALFSWKYFLPLLLPLSIAMAPFGWIFDCSSLMISSIAVLAAMKEPRISPTVRGLLFLSLVALQVGTLYYGLTENPTLEFYWFYPLLFTVVSYCTWAAATQEKQPQEPNLLLAPQSAPAQTSISWKPFLVILTLAVALRFLFLLGLPPFFDESGNILVSIFEPTRSILSPLKQARPFLEYQFAPTGFLPGDPVYIGRAMTACTSLISLTLLYLILSRIAAPLVAILAACFWALSPYHVFHERMVLQDPYVTMFLLASLAVFLLSRNFPTLLIRPVSETWTSWTTAGVFFGFAVATKITAIEILPFLACSVWIFSARRGLKNLLTRDTFNGLLIFASSGVIVLYLISGTFRDFGVDHMSLGHLGDAKVQTQSRLAWTQSHLGKQYDLLSTYLGQPFAWLYGLLMVLGMFFRSTRPFVIMLLLLFLIHTKLYQGRWYTRYLHPDFILHAIFLGLIGAELLQRKERFRFSEWTQARQIRGTLAILSLGLLFWSKQLFPIVFNPLKAAVPKHDSYIEGYVSGLGVRELRAKIDEELSHENRIVIFACQYWGTGMYELLRHSLALPKDKLFVIPFELFHQNRALGILKLMRKFREELPGKTSFYFLFESPRYPRPAFLDHMGIPLTEIFHLLREPPGEDEFHFWIDKIGDVNQDVVLKVLAPQKAPYPDNWLGPKVDLLIGSMPEEDLKLSFPPDLPGGTRIEFTVGNQPILSEYFSEIHAPVVVPKSAFAHASPEQPVALSLRCSDWIIPQLSSGRRDNRGLCAKVSAKLVLATAELPPQEDGPGSGETQKPDETLPPSGVLAPSR